MPACASEGICGDFRGDTSCSGTVQRRPQGKMVFEININANYSDVLGTYYAPGPVWKCLLDIMTFRFGGKVNVLPPQPPPQQMNTRNPPVAKRTEVHRPVAVRRSPRHREPRVSQ